MASITTDGMSSTLGQYSGITASDIEQLLEADSAGKTKAQTQITTLTSQKTAWSDVKTRLTNFLTKVQALESDDTFKTKNATSSNSQIASITGTTAAAEGTYDLKVDQLASATKIVGAQNTKGTKTALGITGTVTLNSAQTNDDGSNKTFDLTIESTDTLTNVVDKVNKQTTNSHIKASIVDNRLVLTNTDMGAKSISVSGTAADALGLGSSATTTTGKSALFELDGLQIERNSNSVSDAIDGVTFTLGQVSDTHVTLSLQNNTSKAVSAVNDLVSQYNSMMSLISDDLDVGDPSSSDNVTGKLVGDGELMRLQSSLRSLITTPTVSGTTLNPASVGISSVDRDGTLGLDQDKLESALAADPDAVKNFFYNATKSVTGTVTSATGYAAGLDSLANKYLTDTSTNKGVIASKTAGFDASIKDLNSQIDDFNTMLTAKKAYYVDMFTRLDQAIMESQSQLSYFTSASSTSSSS
ncbi:flagellar filament capping protein FliD [Liquorilactobacillus satsumensis]|uniref:flagellar filament capping protein FliD n=2 Tax=Liquorilactobacillus satsumensis TaxID=259059 RepID=UPI001E57B23E|nr:flagellar filament capping protein FliD [Liquorilactobacillus satsumensis]MCC7666636.1 flagellar hook protein [Liquorilactobacillus satsumensis]MCP9329242.1 flagellar filament capping protein FliD [Liquorilactobacillus satsumensis]MCP9357803.1 flagellar filament capping protein FliD [Liquorilactobacillus satsumensis]MCP9371543.1 flagellar filament capping protein FliD [Liquorilactobacillus satsumensis]